MNKMKTASCIFVFIFMICTFLSLFAGCNGQQPGGGSAPVQVDIAEVVIKDVPVWSEWTASTDGFVNATIRSQVQGYLLVQNYREGDFVKKGQLLFEIDDRTFRAVLKQAESIVTKTQADWENAKANLARVKPLAEHKAVSARDLDEALRSEGVCKASYEAALAAAEKAELDLKFTKITSPIDGIAGAAKAQVGNLVGPGSTEELTTVSTLDPIKVNVPLTEQEYLSGMRGGQNGQIRLELILADGSVHPHKGKFTFVDRQVDTGTGTIKVAALFPNPGNFLRPGQFARVRAETAVKKGAILVPQRAIIEVQGNREVAVVETDNKINMTPIKTGPRFGDMWVVEEGLKSGQKVVVEGVQKVRQGLSVEPRPFNQASGNHVRKGN